MMSPLDARGQRALVYSCLIASLALVVSSAPVSAKGCAEGSPAAAVPSSLWGELQPQAILNDATDYNGNQLSNSRYAQFTSVDVENGYLFASYWSGFGIWDARSTPQNPTRVSLIDGWAASDCRQGSNVFPPGGWPGCSEFDNWIWALDAPEGDDTFVALGGFAPVGLAVFDTTNKSAPVLRYQDPRRQVLQVYSTTIGGRAYAFAADFQFGIYVYDMTAAREANLSKCLDNSTHTACLGPGGAPIFKGYLANAGAQYVHGAKIGSKSFVVGSAGNGGPTIRMWDVTTPTAPVLVTTGYDASNSAFGVALWKQGASTYLGVRHATTLDIVDVTTCVSGGCPVFPSPLATVDAPEYDSGSWKPVIFSWSGSAPMLFLGHHDLCHTNETSPPTDIQDAHTEYLFDASNPAAPRDITPTATLLIPGATSAEDRIVDYWSWYYSDTVRGYSFEAPVGAKFNGDYLYRAARTILDVHKWAGSGPPHAAFTWSPATPYSGETVIFNDTSSGGVTSRTWSFQDGNPSSGTTNPISVAFVTPGTKSVGLTVSNPNGSDGTSQNVTVLDPSPTVGAASATPPSGPICSTVSWSATGVGGRAPLTVAWSIRNVDNAPVGGGNGNPFAWNSTGTPAGTYTGIVTVSNSYGQPVTASASVTLTAPDPLPVSGTFAPTNDPFGFGTITFHAGVASATEWNWDFGDGVGYRGWTGPYAVANPTFTYTSIGQYAVKVQVRNCVDASQHESAALPINVTNVQPVQVLQFQAQCNVAPCDNSYQTNQAITFGWTVDGGASYCEFDWNHDGTFEESGVSCPNGSGSIAHAFAAVGTYTPVMRAVRGSEHADKIHNAINVTTGAPPPTPTITIGGASTGTPGQSLTFNASASNCSPQGSGWTWTYGDGTVAGSSNTSSLTVSWSTTGTKSLTAKNPGSDCGSAQGNKSVSIATVTPSGLAAAFTFGPSTPGIGQAVAFDGSTSTGSPTLYTWTWDDGSPTTSGASPTASHSFASARTYQVKLEVSKPGASCEFGLCAATVTKSVTVSGGPPPLEVDYTSPACTEDFAGIRCRADVGEVVTFTDTTVGATTHDWTFGDSQPASGVQVSHSWSAPGSFDVTLTAGNGQTTGTKTRRFTVSGPPPPTTSTLVLPWIAQTHGALVQSSDLYLNNPGTTAMTAKIQFRRRGTPETPTPEITKTVGPGATLFASDALKELFGKENISGLLRVTVEPGDVAPVLISFNTTFQADGTRFGQAIPGVPLANGALLGAGAGAIQHLVGLNDNAEKLAYFGISNGGTSDATFRLKFTDRLGNEIGTPGGDLVLTAYGQRQYQVAQIRSLFGIADQDDYRIAIETKSGGPLLPYGANLRLASEDPSYVAIGSTANKKVYLIGALSTPGLNGSLWRSDLVLANTSDEVVITDVTFTGIGASTPSKPPIQITLQPRSTERIANILETKWGVTNTVGVLTLDSNAPGGVYPIVQGDSYDESHPTKRYGQTMGPVTDAEAATAGGSLMMVGLRQDTDYRTTFWLFNPGPTFGSYDVIYRDLAGNELGRISGAGLAPGKSRQFSPGGHPLPGGVATSGFTVQVKVNSGQVLGGGQVISNATNDPAYVQGFAR